MSDTQTASLVLQALALGSTVLGAAAVLLLGQRREKAQSEERLNRLKLDLRIKTARVLVRDAKRAGQAPSAQTLEDAGKPTSEELGVAARPHAPTLGWGMRSRKIQAERAAWESLRSMAELCSAIPDRQDLKDAKRLAHTELGHRVADWSTAFHTAYGVKRRTATACRRYRKPGA